MKSVSTCLIAVLIAVLFSLPAAAGDVSSAGPGLTALTSTPGPVLVRNGPPADFPGRGNSCRIPPPFQPESCICPFLFQPVCGCNGVTYSNACFARCEVRSFTEGACGGGGAV